MRKLGQHVSRGGSDHECVGPLRFGDVVDAILLGVIAPIHLFPQAGDHFVSGKRSKRERLHEFLRRGGHHHVHFHRLALQGAHQLRRFIRSNPARHAYGDSHDVDCSSGDSGQRTCNAGLLTGCSAGLQTRAH